MGREVRRVPEGFEHPKDSRGHFIPLRDGSHEDATRRWNEEKAKWSEGLRTDFKGGWRPLEKIDGDQYEDWAGDAPLPEDYMPAFPDGTATHYMMYETCTEGTPISPAFATPEDLARWLADTGASANGSQTASYEGWLRVARGAFAPSMVFSLTTGLQGGVEASKDWKP